MVRPRGRGEALIDVYSLKGGGECVRYSTAGRPRRVVEASVYEAKDVGLVDVMLLWWLWFGVRSARSVGGWLVLVIACFGC